MWAGSLLEVGKNSPRAAAFSARRVTSEEQLIRRDKASRGLRAALSPDQLGCAEPPAAVDQAACYRAGICDNRSARPTTPTTEFHPMHSRVDRRRFLQSAAVSVVFCRGLQARLTQGTQGNDRVRVAIIGTAGRGADNLNGVRP